MSKQYECTVYYTMCQTVYVEADSMDEAQEMAADMIDPFDADDYVDIVEVDVSCLDGDDEEDW